MHSLMFRFKRAHWRGQALARKLAVNLGELTPSRYDLMRLVAGNGDGKQVQYMLWKALGVSRAAVSNMVRRMMELGLLDRARSLGDGRTFVIWLTEAGVAAFRVASSYIYGPVRPLFRSFERAFGPDSATETNKNAVRMLDWGVETTAKRLGDTSCDLYPSREGPAAFEDVEDEAEAEAESPDDAQAICALLPASSASTESISGPFSRM